MATGNDVGAVGREALTATLAKLRPAKVRATLPDGETRDVAVPKRRKRWAHVVEVLESLQWVRVEALDVKGDILGAIEAEEQLPVDTGKATDREQGLLALLVKAQDMALARHERSLSVLLDGYRVLLDGVLGRVLQLEQGYGATLKLAQEATVALAESRGAGDGSQAEADKLMLDVLQRALKKAGVPVTPDKPKNGAAAKPASDGGAQ